MLLDLLKDFATVAGCTATGALIGNILLPTIVHSFGGAAERFVESFRPEAKEPSGEYWLATEVGTVLGAGTGLVGGLVIALN